MPIQADATYVKLFPDYFTAYVERADARFDLVENEVERTQADVTDIFNRINNKNTVDYICIDDKIQLAVRKAVDDYLKKLIMEIKEETGKEPCEINLADLERIVCGG